VLNAADSGDGATCTILVLFYLDLTAFGILKLCAILYFGLIILVNDNELAFHTDPYFCECRAYGRIKEAQASEKRARKVAARCFGFLALLLMF
jgi:hypothetical protein